MGVEERYLVIIPPRSSSSLPGIRSYATVEGADICAAALNGVVLDRVTGSQWKIAIRLEHIPGGHYGQ